MNHLEELTTEWLDYCGYFTRSTVRVGPRKRGGWDGELDVIGFHPETRHFVHVECSTDAWNWAQREEKFSRKFAIGLEFARDHFTGIELPDKLDQVLVHGFVRAGTAHRKVGGGRLITSQELVAEIVNIVPDDASRSAVPESFPLLRTLQLAKMAGVVNIPKPPTELIPRLK